MKETFFVALVCSFFILSDLFKLTMACYWLFHVLQATTSQNVSTYKFTLNHFLQMSAGVIIKQDSFFELQSEA